MFLFKSAPNYEGAADCFQQALIRAQTTATFTCPCIPVANLSSPAISYHKSQQAAQLLRSPAVRDIQLAVKAFEDAASAHRHAGSLGFSAAALEDAGNTLRDGKQASMAATKYLDASECHKSAGKTDQGPAWTCAWHCMDLNVSVSSALSHEDGRTGNFEKAADVLLKAGKVCCLKY
jgi:tetratricopeptide (TPR) repeat protein